MSLVLSFSSPHTVLSSDLPSPISFTHSCTIAMPVTPTNFMLFICFFLISVHAPILVSNLLHTETYTRTYTHLQAYTHIHTHTQFSKRLFCYTIVEKTNINFEFIKIVINNREKLTCVAKLKIERHSKVFFPFTKGLKNF